MIRLTAGTELNFFCLILMQYSGSMLLTCLWENKAMELHLEKKINCKLNYSLTREKPAGCYKCISWEVTSERNDTRRRLSLVFEEIYNF